VRTLGGGSGSVAVRAVRDPAVVGLVLLAAAAIVLCPLPVGDVRVRVIGFWFSQPILDFLLFAVCRGIARSAVLPAPMRRFWRALGRGGLLFMIGDIAQTVITVRRPDRDAAAPGSIQTIFSVLAIGVIIWSMLTYPLPAGTRRERLRFWLDAATVLVAASVFAWIVTVTPAVTGAGTGMLLGSLFGNGLLVVAAFAAAKLALSGNSPMTRAAALPAAGSALLQGVLNALASGNPGTGSFNLLLAFRVLPPILIVLGPRLQELQMRGDPEAVLHRRRKRFSLLPYVMIAATYVMLFSVLAAGLNLRSLGALVGVVLTSAIVVSRQLMAFAENASLLERLDVSLRETGRQEQRFRSLVQHASDVIMVTGADGSLTYLSPSVERTLGYPAATMLGGPMLDMLHPDDRADVTERMGLVRAADQASVTHQSRYRHADGSWRWLDVISTNLLAEPSVEGIVSNAREVTETRSLHEKLRHQATHDGLTGLPNRSLFAERLAALAGDDSGPVAVLMVDLDGFKQINDSLGHHVGDAVLIAVAHRIMDCIRSTDTAARLGGDEFAILLPGSGPEPAAMVAQRLLDRLGTPFEAAGELLSVGASIGIATDGTGDFEALLRSADSAMYEAKRGGKNRYALAPG
jgi:diguanylate cyclase (GGDEF)-like protein/PAS domain S-box-containing protein